MKKVNSKNIDCKISRFLQYTLNTALVLLAIALGALLFREIYYFISFAFFQKSIENHYVLFEKILLFFLYFEFISMIVKYFQEHYHFPLRYFFYIGITAMIRLVIVDHENAVNTLLYTCAIFVLTVSYYIYNSASIKIKKDNL